MEFKSTCSMTIAAAVACIEFPAETVFFFPFLVKKLLLLTVIIVEL